MPTPLGTIYPLETTMQTPALFPSPAHALEARLWRETDGYWTLTVAITWYGQKLRSAPTARYESLTLAEAESVLSAVLDGVA